MSQKFMSLRKAAIKRIHGLRSYQARVDAWAEFRCLPANHFYAPGSQEVLREERRLRQSPAPERET